MRGSKHEEITSTNNITMSRCVTERFIKYLKLSNFSTGGKNAVIFVPRDYCDCQLCGIHRVPVYLDFPEMITKLTEYITVFRFCNSQRRSICHRDSVWEKLCLASWKNALSKYFRQIFLDELIKKLIKNLDIVLKMFFSKTKYVIHKNFKPQYFFVQTIFS